MTVRIDPGEEHLGYAPERESWDPSWNGGNTNEALDAQCGWLEGVAARKRLAATLLDADPALD